MEQLGTDIFTSPLWTPERCQEIIKKAEEDGGGFAPLAPRDKYQTQDVILSESDNPMIARLWKEMLPNLMNLENSIREEWWINQVSMDTELSYYGFIVKYELGVQESLRLHTDESDITISVRLNDNYKGCVLEFPRQNIQNSEVPIGDAMIFPGSITHPHHVHPLEEGTKYTLTVWLRMV